MPIGAPDQLTHTPLSDQRADENEAGSSAGKEELDGLPGPPDGDLRSGGRSGDGRNGVPNACICDRCEKLPGVPIDPIIKGAATAIGAATAMISAAKCGRDVTSKFAEGLSRVGFGSSGVGKRTIASHIQSNIGNVKKDSLFANFQKMGMRGASSPLLIGIGAVAAVANLYCSYKPAPDAVLVHVSYVDAQRYPCVNYVHIASHMPQALAVMFNGTLLEWKLVGPAKDVLELRFAERAQAEEWVKRWHVIVPEELRQLVVEVVG
ncbi:hypothetical protein FA95DRAFT_1612313 [Auriscalpium vulgare]|uniref:Uncharacterized protein n=1 Tax=Auriscalpium vulgare TaxID=40419 RepID=A0ACB8R7L3_9AGAM|nr:hypothetical protein FA95DRAFT_1612313 [Auriscalpium vulgare]